MFELNTDTTRHLILILYGVLLGTLGNLLYRVNNSLKISPIIIRLLNGAVSLAIYILLMIFSKGALKLNLITMFVIILIGYFVELIVEILDDKLPGLLDRIIEKYIGKPPEGKK